MLKWIKGDTFIETHPCVTGRFYRFVFVAIM